MEGSAATLTMAALLSTITEVFTASTGWMASVADIVVANPLFLIPIVFTFLVLSIDSPKQNLNIFHI